jgi:hypothetical protein
MGIALLSLLIPPNSPWWRIAILVAGGVLIADAVRKTEWVKAKTPVLSLIDGFIPNESESFWRKVLVFMLVAVVISVYGISIWPLSINSQAPAQVVYIAPATYPGEDRPSVSSGILPADHVTKTPPTEATSKNLPKPPKAKTEQEPLTLKGLFLSEFSRPDINSNGAEDTLIFRQPPQPDVPLNFSAKLWMDMNAKSEFLTFYIPSQDQDPEKAESKTFLLGALLVTHLEKILVNLHGLQFYDYTPGEGKMRKSTELVFTRRVIIYHEDFLSPQDIANLDGSYASKNLSVEFRDYKYLAEQNLWRALRMRK